MIDTPSVDWLALSPVLALLGASGVALLGAVLVPRWMRRALGAFAVFAGFVTAGILAGVVYYETSSASPIIAESMTRDRWAALGQILLAGAGALAVLVSWGERRRFHGGEYYALLAAAGAGMLFFVQAGNLMTLFLGLEWFSLCLYVLCAMDTDRETSLEAGLKYLIVGSFGSAVLLFGSALVVTFRVLTTAFAEQEDVWRIAVAVIACASLAIGNLAALVQRDVKRLLAYSSVSHAGFMLIAVAAANELGGRALLYYLIPYGAMSIGAFAVVAARERELQRPVTLDSLAGFGWERPFLGFAMWVFMLGFAGFPLTGGMLGKLYVFSAAYDSGWWWLVVAGVIATAVSLYYYLAVVLAMYMRSELELRLAPAGGSPPRDPLLAFGVFLCLAVTVGSFGAVQPLVDLARDAAAHLPL